MSKDTLKALTPAQRKAIDYVGRHRKTKARVGKSGISRRMFNTLAKMRLVMWLEEGRSCMLTYWGERVFTVMHPYSKYRIK